MQNVITSPSDYQLRQQDLRLAISVLYSNGPTFKGKPIDYFVRVYYGYEEGSINNGVFLYEESGGEAKKCERSDFDITEDEENTLGL